MHARMYGQRAGCIDRRGQREGARTDRKRGRENEGKKERRIRREQTLLERRRAEEEEGARE